MKYCYKIYIFGIEYRPSYSWKKIWKFNSIEEAERYTSFAKFDLPWYISFICNLKVTKC